MTETCVYIMTSVLLVLIVVVHCLLKKLDGFDKKLDEFTEIGNNLKKFSKNMEALFKVEKKKG